MDTLSTRNMRKPPGGYRILKLRHAMDDCESTAARTIELPGGWKVGHREEVVAVE